MRGKPPVSLRRPPPAAAPRGRPPASAAETFVTGKRLDAQTSSRVVSRADGRELRRLTVYLPVALARRLAVHCAQEDLELSRAIAVMVAAALPGP